MIFPLLSSFLLVTSECPKVHFVALWFNYLFVGQWAYLNLTLSDFSFSFSQTVSKCTNLMKKFHNVDIVWFVSDIVFQHFVYCTF